jgi:hypothetical protein
MTAVRVLASVAVLLASASLRPAARAPASQERLELAAVIERASRFAVRQRDALSDTRADEDYIQELLAAGGTVLQARHLESEMAFVQLSDSEEWLAFRNVMRIDGVPTGTDTARLEKLFRLGAVSQQGRRIAAENARHNIGNLQRTLNVPTIVTHLLMPGLHGRFRFRKRSEINGPERAWLVAFDERDRPTIVRTTTGRDVPLAGALSIAVDDGRLLRATVEADVPIRSELEFTWRRDAVVNAWVPAMMRERYRKVRDTTARTTYDIVAVARYSNYRRFVVDVRIK